MPHYVTTSFRESASKQEVLPGVERSPECCVPALSSTSSRGWAILLFLLLMILVLLVLLACLLSWQWEKKGALGHWRRMEVRESNACRQVDGRHEWHCQWIATLFHFSSAKVDKSN
jgi:hypothetical protein